MSNQFPVPYDEAISMIQKISEASGKYKAIGSLYALGEIFSSQLISEINGKQFIDSLVQIAENSLSRTADVYRYLYSILYKSKESGEDLLSILIYLTKISAYSGIATEYVYEELIVSPE